MALPRWAIALGATWLLSSPVWAAPGAAENLDFRLSVESIAWTSTGFVVKAQIENRTGSPELFLHHEANHDDPEAFAYTPGAAASASLPRRTFTLKGLKTSRTAATLAFGVGPEEDAGLLIVGETRAPYRQVAIALKPLLPARPVAQQPPVAQATIETHASPQPAPVTAPAEPGVIARYKPPHATFGDMIVMSEGTPGPHGEGWARIYTELPDIGLDELKRVLESPAQIWQGSRGHLYMRNVGGKRALAIEVSNARVISARYVTPQTLGQVVGPRTRYPKRVYMGRP
jgi:hypothetical protein